MFSASPVRKNLSAAACLLGLAVGVHAQPAAPAAPPAPAASDDVIELSVFTVREEANRGYVASESMTGTRVATQIKDLPFTVNVLTSEFFEDFGMFELADNLTHIGGFTSLDIGGGFTLRGFGSTSQLRDGFLRLGRYGASNVDRVEVIKGPNAAIYGRSSPGGMINMISKQPKKKNMQKINIMHGDLDHKRYGGEFTGTIGDPRTYYILTLSQFERGFETEMARNRNREAYLAVKHDFKDNSSLMVSAEYFLQIRHSPHASAPIITDAMGTASTADDKVIGYAKNLAYYNPAGPFSELNRGNVGFVATYEKRFSPLVSFRAASNYYRARRWDYNAIGWGAVTINPSTGAAPTSQRGTPPNKGYIFEDGGGFQADTLFHYWFGNKAVENKTLITLDINDYYRYDPTWSYGPATLPEVAAWNAVRTVTLDPTTLRPVGQIGYFPNWFQWGNESNTRLTRRRTTVFGGLLRHQMNFFENRLLTYAGARFDHVSFREHDYVSAVAGFRAFGGQYANYNQGDLITRTVKELKPNVGANYAIFPNLRIYANYSESYFVDQTTNPIDIANPTYKQETAKGYDYGFKGSFFNDKLNFTVSGYYANRYNVQVSEFVELPPVGSGNFGTVNFRDGDQLVRGLEVDVTWNITNDLSTGLSYGHVNSIYTDFGSASPLSKYRSVTGVSPDNGGAYVKYTPGRGMLKGWSANIGATYVSSTPSEQPNQGDVYSTTFPRTFISSTDQWKLRVPSYTVWSGGVRYKFRAGPLEHQIGLNVNNLFDKDYLRGNRQPGERQSFFVTYTLTH